MSYNRLRKPFDKFEPSSPNGNAICKSCKTHVERGTERVGIQRWNEEFSRWTPSYYHRGCCSEGMIESLNLPLSGSKRQREDDSSPTSSAVKKLRAERDRQMNIEAAKRHLIYSERADLRKDLRRLRMELSTQEDVKPYRIFDDATLDDIVTKLPRNRFQLMRCRGIAQKRCDKYGKVILDVLARHRK